VLIAIAAGIVLSRYGLYTGATVGHVPAGWPPFGIDFAWAEFRQLILPGLVIAFVGFAEPAAIARALSTQERLPWNAERELVAQGAANVAAAVCNAFPVGGSFSRTALAHTAGAKSRASGAITGLVVLACLPWADWLAGLPRAVLAGVIIAAVVKLIRAHELVSVFAVSRAQAMVGASALVLTLALAPRVDVALMVSIGLGIAVHLWRETRIIVVARHDGEARTLTVEPVGVLYFGSAQTLYDALIAELAHDRDVTRVIFDLRRLGRIDYTGAMALHRVATDAAAAGLTVTIVPGLHPQGVRLLRRVFGEESPWIAAG
jgi:SulP family sulfate permease